ncbi:unnamed protein product [Oppiella nova]|uniref:Uncharacterized protein n=1 Tax=Oppiella nova TaxID=334625 RepID=A0A7R9R2T7_9ACAR|nr:unnamed protein product [Oppiella nova]CAG2183562.1 unnamed protein product [Oppiella nova]
MISRTSWKAWDFCTRHPKTIFNGKAVQ